MVDLLDALSDDDLRAVIEAARPNMPGPVAFAVAFVLWNPAALRSQARQWAQQFDDFKADLDDAPWLKDLIGAAMRRVRTKHFEG